tara:strand:+ start:642 stop:1769 length:1128 start_codon:yes stop_codon:yes gene_type:complete
MQVKFMDLKAQYNLIKDDIESSIKNVLDHGQYILGPEVSRLEKELSEFTGVKHCIAASSGTDTLLMSLMALDIGIDDEVITTPFTFISTVEVIALLGAKPVFVDIDSETYNIDHRLIEEKISKKTKAIIPVSLYGQCPDFDEINQLAEKYKIPVIEDAAQSFGATYKGKRSCSLSTIGSTSFFPSKPLGCYGDGGALFTNDDHLAKILREIRAHGQDRRYHHPRIGVNGRLDTMQAAVLLEKLKIFDEEIILRNSLAKRYIELLSTGLENSNKLNIVLPKILDHNKSVFGQFTIQIDHREDVVKYLKSREIPTAVHYPVPLNEQPAYKNFCCEGCTPISSEISKRVLSLPFSPYLDTKDQDKIIYELLNLPSDFS